MKFEVTRTSQYREGKPCDEAVETEVVIQDKRTFKTPEEHDAKFADSFGPWLSKGTNHGTWSADGKSGICRNLGTRKGFVVKIGTLKGLMAFIKKYGTVILTEDEIEIYDTYRD